RRAEAIDRHRLADEAAGTLHGPLLDESSVDERTVRGRTAATVRHSHVHAEPVFTARRHLPQHFVAIEPGFGDLQVPGAHLVCVRAAGSEPAQHQGKQPGDAPHHGLRPSPAPTPTPWASMRISYLARSFASSA